MKDPSIPEKRSTANSPFPNYLKKSSSSFLIDSSYIQPEARTSPRHKYEAGVSYVIAGSEGLTGAANAGRRKRMVGRNRGCHTGLPHMAICPFTRKHFRKSSKKPVGSREDYFFKTEHLDEIASILKEKKAESFRPRTGSGRRNSSICP
ncbi:MAG: hypothetical protein U5K69_03645 [Balneolaceae bacterium]|nr:hypothetical protein [Balneolaceae bacterium]